MIRRRRPCRPRRPRRPRRFSYHYDITVPVCSVQRQQRATFVPTGRSTVPVPVLIYRT
jgi:hypothetical protein